MLSRSAWILAACGACVLLRGPAFRYGVISDDEAIYDTMAQEIIAGGVMYRSAVNHKPPGIVYTYAALESLAGNGERRMAVVHLFGVLAALGTCFGLYWIGRKILAPPSEVIAPVLYAVISAAKVPCDGLAVNGELLMNLPTALAVACALEATNRSRAHRIALDVLSGILLAVAVLYKYQAGVLLGALPYVMQAPRTRWLSRATSWAIGFALPLTICASYFYERGALHNAIRWGVVFNVQYVRDGASLAWSAVRLGRQFVGVIIPGAILYVSATVTLVRLLRGSNRVGDIRQYPTFLLVWSLLSIGSVAIGGRYFGHYFLQAELPLSIAAAGPAARLWLRSNRAFTAALAGPALLFALGASMPAQPGRWLDDDSIDYEMFGAAVAARTNPSDTIWIWGNVPRIYYAARRRLGVRFPFCNYLTGLSPGTQSESDMTVGSSAPVHNQAWSLVFEDLTVRRPRLILDTASARLKSYGKYPIRDFPEFAKYLSDHYRPNGNINGAIVYDRVQ